MKPTHIFVLQGGWVFAGVKARTDTMLIIEHASCIRRWGTTAGLGQLALSGPQKNTVLDPCGTLEAPMSTVLFWIPVTCKKWD